MIALYDYPVAAVPIEFPFLTTGQRITAAGLRVNDHPAWAVVWPSVREDAASLIVRALEAADSDFVRIDTLAARTGLSRREVRSLVEDSAVARHPWGRPDLDAFTLPSRPVSVRERISLVWSYLANRR